MNQKWIGKMDWNTVNIQIITNKKGEIEHFLDHKFKEIKIISLMIKNHLNFL
jgi:hypothetical protein